MQAQIQLLIIDPQNDFCDLPDTLWPLDAAGSTTAPALPVAGAHADLQRVAGLIDAGGAGLSDIVVTLDSHLRVDIAHPPFWQQRDGAAWRPVAPFTPITAAQVRAGEFQPRDSGHLPRALDYLDALEARGRYTLMVWPVHCEIGSWGHDVHADVQAACKRWEAKQGQKVHRVTKGENPWTEHYSALLAEVPDAADPHTQLNRDLLARLDTADHILIAGEASSHCVKATTEHLIEHLPGGRPQRLTLLTDTMSPVAGFAAQHDAFVVDMQARGVQLAITAQVLSLLQANTPR